jgi:hypothetical protein
MRSRLALARRRAGRDIKVVLSTIRERLAMIFRDHGRRSRQMFPSTLVIQYPMRRSMITDAVPLRRFHRNGPAALLIPAEACHRRNQVYQPSAAAPDQEARRWLKAANLTRGEES